MTKTYKNFPNDLKVSKDFSDFVPPMAKEDFGLLFQNIKHDGYIRDPLITWNGTILDGHHRYKIAEMLDLEVPVKTIEFESKENAQYWIAKNQTGQRRLTKSQQSVFALNMLPMFTKIGKQLQSEGGKTEKGKGKEDKGFNANEEAASLARVGVNMLKDIKNIYDNTITKPMVELIRIEAHDGLTVKEAKALKKKFEAINIQELMNGNDLSEKGITALNLLRHPKAKTEADKAAEAAEKSAAAATEAADKAAAAVETAETAEATEAADKAAAAADIATDAAAEATAAAAEADKATDKEIKKEATETAIAAKKAAQKAAAEAEAETAKLTGTTILRKKVDGTTQEENKSLITGNDVAGTMEGDRFKRYVQDTKAKIYETFPNKVACIDKTEDPENYVIDLINKLKNGTAFEGDNSHENIVLIVATNATHSTWFQKASALSAFFTDSNEYPVRMLYYGENGLEYYNELFTYGISSALINIQQQQLSGSNPKQISGRVGSAFTMPRDGKAPKKAPSAAELLKRAKKKAPKKTPKK